MVVNVQLNQLGYEIIEELLLVVVMMRVDMSVRAA